MRKITAAVVIFIICLSLAACGNNLETDDEEEQLMNIEIEYGVLHYPSEWEKDLIIEEENEGGILSVAFKAQIANQQYTLFQVMICGEEGDSAGTLIDENGTSRNVFIDIQELTDISDLDETAQNQLYAMQEGVNVLINNLQ